MNDSVVKVYGFVNDTAFYRRSEASSYEQINQRACCATDKVNAALVEPSIIYDPRGTNRLLGKDIFTEIFDRDPTPTAEVIENGTLSGKMSLIVDKKKIDENVWNILNSDENVANLFRFIEVLGLSQKIGPVGTETIAPASVFSGPKAQEYKTILNANYIVSDKSLDVMYVSPVTGYFENGGDSFQINLAIRDYINFTCVIGGITIEFNLFWSEECFLENYPISSIVKAIFPCEEGKLYNILDNYPSMTDFANASSAYYIEQMNNVVASGDQTGVMNLQLLYIATPDDNNTDTMNLTFGIVYKGAKPTSAEAKDFLANEILKIDIGVEQDKRREAWKKKIPGLFSDMRMFIIPLYENNVQTTNRVLQKPFYATSEASIKTLINKYLVSDEEKDFLSQLEYVELLKMDVSGVLCLVVPDPVNPTTKKRISDMYFDMLSVTSNSEYATHDYMLPDTLNMHTALNSAISSAADKLTPGDNGVPNTHLKTTWVTFSPDDMDYFVLTKKSFMEM